MKTIATIIIALVIFAVGISVAQQEQNPPLETIAQVLQSQVNQCNSQSALLQAILIEKNKEIAELKTKIEPKEVEVKKAQ